MESFKSFMDRELFVEFAQQAFHAGSSHQKPLSATKDEIVGIWKQLRPDTPLYITPLSDAPNPTGEKSTYGEDGVRITGSWPFIAGVLGRLKDFLNQETPQTNLRLVFRGINSARQARPDSQSYAFYVNLEKRGADTMSEI